METNDKVFELMVAYAYDEVKARISLEETTKKEDYFKLIEFLTIARDDLTKLIEEAKDDWSDERERRKL